MAAGKNDKNVSNVSADSKNDFDFQSYLPEGWSAKELRKIDGLTPIYAPELALDHKWTPCVGFMDRIISIDFGEDQKDNRFREFIVMQLTADTKGVRGDKSNREVVDVKAGEDILMPMSGNIKNITVLRAALANNEKVYIGAFRVTGKLDTGMPTPMWKIDSFLHPKSDKRQGRFLLGMDEKHEPALENPSATGAATNAAVPATARA